MSYKLNKTDGTLLVDLIDGTKNNTSTDITLIGRNSTGFGESINENFIKILENFSNTAAPANPLEGQLWFDRTTDTLKVYDGDDFKNAGGAYVTASQPSMSQGDFWYNTTTKQMFTFDGDNAQLIGPQFTFEQGTTGEVPDIINDIQGFPRSVIKHYVGGNLIGVWSNLEFKIAATNTDDVIEGLTLDTNNNRIVKRGFNILDADYKIRGTVTNAEGIGGIDISKLVRTDLTSTIDAGLIIRGGDGLKFGSIHEHKYSAGEFTLNNLVANDDFSINVKGTATGVTSKSAIFVDSSAGYVGIYNRTPEAELHVGTTTDPGNVIIEGNLTVKGTTTAVESTTLRVKDKNIELGTLEDSTIGDDTAIDGAGITVLSTGGSKDLSWMQATGSWTSNQDFNLVSGKAYKINGNDVITENALSSNITSAPGLTSLGTLSSFGTNFLTISGSTVSTTNGQHLNLAPAGDVVVNTSIIRGVSDGTTDDSVPTKGYVDTQVNSSDIAFAMDATGLSNTDIRNYLNTMFPTNVSGRICRVLATTYAFAALTDVEAAKTITPVSVDRNGQLEFEAVVKNVVFTDATTTVTMTPSRTIKTFAWDGTTWLFQA